MTLKSILPVCLGITLLLIGCKTSRNAIPQDQAKESAVIVAIGDSITMGAHSAQGGYPALLEARLRDEGYDARVLNKGQAGEKAYQTRERFEKAIEEADIVLLMIGFNDLTRPEECPEPHHCRTLEHIAAMLDMAINAGKMPVVSAVTPAQPGNIRDWANPAIRDLNADMAKLAAQRNVCMVDNFTALWEQRQNRVFSDHAHPNDRGYALIAEQWLAALIQHNVLKKNAQ